MDHQNLEKTTSASLMLPKEERNVVLIPSNGVGKMLIREDTLLNNLPGCAGCGRAQFNCSGVKKQWSVLCWGRQSDKKYYCLLLLLSATFALSLIGTIFFCSTNAINDVILSSMVIKNNTLAFSMWRRPAVQPLMKVHIFNYTNWERVRDGLDPRLHVEDVGPYVYSQKLERVNIDFNGDQLTYQESNNFKFLPEKSVGAHFDQVIVPNLPLLGAASKAISMPYFMQLALQTSLNSFANNHEAFLRLPVARFLWGYDDDIINAVKPLLSIQGKLKFEKFGLLVTKNGTVSDRLTINTGERDITRMNMIEKLDGKSHLEYWGSPECNSLDASDGTIFPPSMLDGKTTLHVFFPNLCRRLPFFYEKDVEIDDGVQLMRYRMPKNVFDVNNPANQCYCDIDTATCPPRGVINVTACAMGAPAFASFPHFHLGDPKLREDISGLKPDPVLHDSYVDIHPKLGIALGGKSSLQVNIQVKKTKMFGSLKFLKQDLVLPIAWMEMTVEELPQSIKSLVYHGTFSTAAAQLGLTVACIIALFVSGICLFVMLVRKRRKPCVTLKIKEGELKNQLSR